MNSKHRVVIKKHVIIMAGGSGTRMKSPLPKQILNVHHKPMLVHIMDQLYKINQDDVLNVILVLSEKNKDVIINNLVQRKFLIEQENVNKENEYYYKNLKINLSIQDTKNFKGTGGAIMSCENYFTQLETEKEILKSQDIDIKNHILILSADVPLITRSTIINMFQKLKDFNACILTKYVENNDGLGRVILKDKSIEIVEHKDCNEEQLKVKLINTGIYSFEMDSLRDSLKYLNKNNSQGELYLTDTIKHISKINTLEYIPVDYDETFGANTQEQLDELNNGYLQKFTIEDILSNNDNLTDTNLKNLCHVYNQLSPTNDSDLNEIKTHILNTKNNTTNKMKIYVVKYEDEIIGTASIIIETKILRNLSKVAHVEDVVIDSEYRGLGLSKTLLNTIIDYAKSEECYKIILDCSNNLIKFYQKFGFNLNANTMRLDL